MSFVLADSLLRLLPKVFLTLGVECRTLTGC